MSRRCEVLGPDGWRSAPLASVREGDVFRLFDAETGEPVMDYETGAIRWRASADATPRPDGQSDVQAEPVPETEAERAVRVSGTYWPNAASPRLHGINRLRGR